jgi:preprotein translocase subunit SecE
MKFLSIGNIVLIIIAGAAVFAVIANFAKIKKFILEVIIELKKVSWSTRKELLDATKIVLMSSFLLGLFIGLTDFALSRILGLIIR